jgi:hypothetical protein
MSNERMVGFATGAVVLLAIAFGGWKASTGIAAAKQAQARALDNLLTWKAAYQALLPVKARWSESFQLSVDPAQQDMVGIGQSLRLAAGGLGYDINTIRSDRVESVLFEGVPVGLMRTCVSGGDSTGLRVTADSMRTMLKGVSSLVRHDIEFNKLDVSSIDGRPVAMLSGLCVLSRRES